MDNVFKNKERSDEEQYTQLKASAGVLLEHAEIRTHICDVHLTPRRKVSVKCLKLFALLATFFSVVVCALIMCQMCPKTALR